MLLGLKRTIIYGPVSSRRIGRSLGINLLPAGAKACPFDCVYCQYGWTDRARVADLGHDAFPTPAAVAAALEQALAALAEPPDVLTFSGNGEPTSHPGFVEAVDAVLAVRDRCAPRVPVAILSNGAGVLDAGVRAALRRLEVRIMKLDAGDDATLARFNGALPPLTVAALVAGLRELGEVTLQSLLAAGPAGNLDASHLAHWLDAVSAVAPRQVQLYTIARDTPSRELAPAPRAALEALAASLAERSIPATVFG